MPSYECRTRESTFGIHHLAFPLSFSDFGLLEPDTVRQVLTDPQAQLHLGPALSNSPRVLFHFVRSCPDLEEQLLDAVNATPASDPAGTAAARRALVRAFAFELLREKSPPLYDALPWNDWDISAITCRFRLWRTRLLIAGEFATVLPVRLRRTAGLYVLEPLPIIRRYIRKKAAREDVKRLVVVPGTLDHIPAEVGPVDLAVVGPTLGTDPEQGLAQLKRTAATVLLVRTRPGAPPLPDRWLLGHGFIPDRVRINPTGRDGRCWWHRRS